MRAVVIGASSGLGWCIGTGLAKRGASVALMARQYDKLQTAAAEAGGDAVAITCDVTDPDSCQSAIDEAAAALGGIDALVYTPAIGPLAWLTDLDAETWGRAFATNVTGAALATSAALKHLQASSGRAMYLSSVSASQFQPWPGFAGYTVTKAALDKLVEAWRAEHPGIGFTRLVVGDCSGGEGDGRTHFADNWDPDIVGQVMPIWMQRGYVAGCLIDVDELVQAVDGVLRAGASIAMPSVVVMPRPAD